MKMITIRHIGLAISLLLILTGCNRKNTSGDTSSPPVGQLQDSPDRGELIIAEHLKRTAAPFRKSLVKLTVTSEKDPTQTYLLAISRKQTGDETLTLTEVVEPKEDQDLATLTVEQKDKPTVNITYIASSKKFRESGTGKSFFGGVTAQELLGEWHKYKTRLVSEQVVDGAKMFELESKLRENEDSAILRYHSLFRADNFLPYEMKLYGSDDKLLRRFAITKTRSIEGRQEIWRTEIENYIFRTKILLEVLEVSFPARIPDKIFDREYLKSKSAKLN